MGSVVHLFLPFRSLTPASPRIPHSLFASFPTPFISDLDDGVVKATGKMRMCGRADLRILERVRVKIMDLD